MSFLSEEQKAKCDKLMRNISVKFPFNSNCMPSFSMFSQKRIEDMTDIEKDFFYLEICKNASVQIPDANQIYLHGGEYIERKNRFGVYKEYEYFVFWEKLD